MTYHPERAEGPRGGQAGTGDRGIAPAAIPPPAAAAPTPVPVPAPYAEDTSLDSGPDTRRPLLPRGQQEKVALRMRQAVSDFVESPRRAVQEADSAFEEMIADLTDALAERRHTLRAGWQGQDTGTRTEELRIALQNYRDVTERLLRI